ncbi:MAG: malate dehydrogenase [Fimbriimonadaceae bacterium]
MKVSIIGGGGRVGSDAAFALQLGGIVREIVLVDANAELAAGEALDLLHGSAFTSSQRITSGGYEAVEGSDCVVITAGLRRRPDESRLELINRNVDLFKGILDSLKGVKLSDQATILVVSNPVDILTYLAVKSEILPEKQIFGLGTVLDTSRFRSLIARYFGVGATDVNAVILGEHGDTMVPIWSSATIAGVPMSSLPGFDQTVADKLFQETKTSGAEVIRQKGGAGRAVGVSIQVVVEAQALEQGVYLPVSSVQHGIFGIENVALSLPTVISRRGVETVLEPNVSEEEKAKLQESGKALRSVLDQLNL